MPYNIFNLQLFGEEGMADTGDFASSAAENPVGDGVATESTGEQIAPAQDEESFDSLIKGKYKKEYDAKIKAQMDKRFRNQKDLQGQIDMLNPMVQALATKYGVLAGADGKIPIDALTSKVLDDDAYYQDEAFERGMSVEDLKQIKSLERENAMLRMNQQRSAEQEEWDRVVQQGVALKEMYPSFDMDTEMQNPQFGRLLATFEKSGFPNALQTAYEAVHREEIMGGAMRYAVQQTQQKISNSIQSGMSRPSENGTQGHSAGAPTSLDPSKLTKAQMESIKMRAQRGERITF